MNSASPLISNDFLRVMILELHYRLREVFKVAGHSYSTPDEQLEEMYLKKSKASGLGEDLLFVARTAGYLDACCTVLGVDERLLIDALKYPERPDRVETQITTLKKISGMVTNAPSLIGASLLDDGDSKPTSNAKTQKGAPKLRRRSGTRPSSAKRKKAAA